MPGLTIGSPVAMCYIWEEKSGLISRDFKYLAICETPLGGRKAQRRIVVGPFACTGGVVRQRPSRRPRSKSNPQSGRILSISRAPRGGGGVQHHRTFTVERTGGVPVPPGRPPRVNLRGGTVHNEVHTDALFRIADPFDPLPNQKGFLDSGCARTCLYKCFEVFLEQFGGKVVNIW